MENKINAKDDGKIQSRKMSMHTLKRWKSIAWERTEIDEIKDGWTAKNK